MTRIAAIQMASGPNVTANLNEAGRLLAEVAQGDFALCVLPENFAAMPMRESDLLDIGETPGDGPIQNFLAQQAAKHGVWLAGGTVPLRSEHNDKVRSACLLFNDKGEQVARYDKMHLFDVTLSDKEEDRYRESNTFEPGTQPVVVDTPFGRLGLAICYDLRFPELFRALSEQGAEIIALPAAFTAVTGRAHWEVLVRARAIENLCHVVAAAQGGYHVNGRETYGDSLIVDPWGIVLARMPRNTGIICAACDLARQRSLRQTFPALNHRTLHCHPHAS